MSVHFTFIILATYVLISQPSTLIIGQIMLDEHKTQEILQAQANLDRAYSDPGLIENERLKMIRNSAIKLKEYGQPPMPLADVSPLRKLMELNYKQKQKEAIEANNLIGELNLGLLKNKTKFINNLQIDVTGEQIKFLIPGVTPVDMSSDVVSTLFQWNIADGAHGGQRASAKSLKTKILELVSEKDSLNRVELQRQYKFKSLEKLDKDRKALDQLEDKMRKAYENSERSTNTRQGYENARLYEGETLSINPRIVGTWTFSAPGFIVTHEYSRDGYCNIRVNATRNQYKFTTSNGFISYKRPGKKVKKLGYTIEGNQLFMGQKEAKE